MKREEHLTKQKQYSLVHFTGKSWTGNLLSMRLMPNGLNFSRYGLIVSKRVGKAVVRNRIKRLLREILRLAPIKPGWDIIFIARPVAASTKYAELKESVESLLSRAQLLVGNYEGIRLKTN